MKIKRNIQFWLALALPLGAAESFWHLWQQCLSGNDSLHLPNFGLWLMFFAAIMFSVFWLSQEVFIWLSGLPRWRQLRRINPTFGTLLTLILLFYAEEDWRGWHAWEKYKHAAEARGENFDVADFIPPPVPDNQNFALTPVVASSYAFLLDKNGHRLIPEKTNIVNRLEMSIYPNYDSDKAPTNGAWEKGQFTDLKAWQAYYHSELPQLFGQTNKSSTPSTAQSPAEDVLLALGKYDATIEELRQASQLPLSRFPLNYETNLLFNVLMPNLNSCWNVTHVLALRATAELELGQTQKALADVNLGLRLAGSIRDQPLLISLEIRIIMLWTVLQPVADGLVSSTLLK